MTQVEDPENVASLSPPAEPVPKSSSCMTTRMIAEEPASAATATDEEKKKKKCVTSALMRTAHQRRGVRNDPTI